MNGLPSAESQLTRTIIISIGYSILFLIAIPGNIFIIYAIIVNRNTTMASSTFRLILNSALADLVFALVSLPITYMEDTFDNWYIGKFLCFVLRPVSILLFSLSIISMMCIAIDRFITILCHSRQVQRCCRLTNNTLAICYIVITWIISIAAVVPQYLITAYRKISDEKAFCYIQFTYLTTFRAYFIALPIIFFLIPIIVMISCYAAISYYLLRRSRQSSLSQQLNNGNKGTPTRVPSNPGPKASKKSKIHQRDVNVIRMLIATVITFLIFWLPYNIFVVYVSALPSLAEQATFNNKHLFILIPVMKFLGCCHCCHNPIIYLIFNKNFQATLFKIRWVNYITRCCFTSGICKTRHPMQTGQVTVTTSNQKLNVTDERDRRLTSMENIWRDICTSHRTEPKSSMVYASGYHYNKKDGKVGQRVAHGHPRPVNLALAYDRIQDDELDGALLSDNLIFNHDSTVV